MKQNFIQVDDTNNREISLGLTPDLTWIKARSVAYSHILFDRIRGLGFSLNSNGTNADRDVGTEFSWSNSGCTTDSFTVDRGSNETLNETGRTMVAWNWKANGAGVANTDGSISSTVQLILQVDLVLCLIQELVLDATSWSWIRSSTKNDYY